jgi:DUF4097 and DUF4098 domain-containing protein YvlB
MTEDDMSQKKLVLLVVIVLVSLFFFLSAVQAEEHKEEFSKVLPLSAKGAFSLDNVNGSVTITTWTEEKVEIKALKTTKKDAENLEKVKIEVKSGPDFVSVETIYPKLKNTGVSVTYDVKVPEGVNLNKVSTVNGGVSISGPFGKVSASTVNGTVFAEKASGELSFSTTNGDIEALKVKGRIESHTVNGSIKLDIAELENKITAETVNGGITLQLSSTEELNANLRAETVNGGISVDFPVSFQNLNKTKHMLEGRIGQGGPAISLETVNGSIRLTK